MVRQSTEASDIADALPGEFFDALGLEFTSGAFKQGRGSHPGARAVITCNWLTLERLNSVVRTLGESSKLHPTFLFLDVPIFYHLQGSL